MVDAAFLVAKVRLLVQSAQAATHHKQPSDAFALLTNAMKTLDALDAVIAEQALLLSVVEAERDVELGADRD